MSVGRHGLGHIPAPGHRWTPVGVALSRVGLAEAPPELDLAPTLGEVTDQGTTNSCEAHAASKALSWAMTKAGTPLGFTPSMVDMYRFARRFDQARITPSGALPPLEDVGTEGNAVIRAFQEIGVRPMDPRPEDGRFSDCDPATVNNEPELGDLERDASCRLVGAYSILDQTLPDVATAFAQALNAFGPIPTAFWCDDSFQSWTPDRPPAGAPNWVKGGYHKILVVGYDRRGPGGTRRWKILNSWGSGWGEGGYAYGSDDWLTATTEREVYAVMRAS